MDTQPGGVEAVARLAAGQRGLIHLEQLRAAEVGPTPMRTLVRQGLLTRVRPRVYAVGAGLAPLAAETASLMSLGHDAVLSHRSAAAVWGLIDAQQVPIAVTVIGRDARLRGVERHRVAWLASEEVRLREGLPLCSPARTLIDLASGSETEVVEEALARARVRGLFTGREMERALTRHSNRSGIARMRSVLEREGGPVITRSVAERRFRALLRRAELPEPEVNAPLLGFVVDFLWPAQKLVLEVDGLRYHGSRRAFETDRRRDQVLVAAGYRVVRVTWRQFTEEPIALAVRIGQALVAGGRDARP